MTPPVLTNQRARRLFLQAQGLNRPPHLKLSNAALHGLVRDLGYVQVDSINTVERAHHMILFARNQTYKQAQLTRLLEDDAHLFENWTHDAAIIPNEFYAYWQPRFARERERLRARWRKWRRDGFEAHFEDILSHIETNGPVMARELGNDGGKTAGGWWDWHPTKTALEYLWRTGDLAVARRENFQKVYDLTHRVIPDRHRRHLPDHADYVDWACAGAIRRLVFATPGEIAGFWGGMTAKEADDWCRANLGTRLIEVAVEPAGGGRPVRAYADAETFETAGEPSPAPARLRILSPFDPALRDRKRTSRLFGFDYRIEVFVPAPQRQYGYYVFPILEGERLVGRIDMKCERQRDLLAVSALWPEPGVDFSGGRLKRLEAELERQRRFAGVAEVRFADGWLRGPAPARANQR
jgi:uncharacterized protein YcaQ